MKCNFELKKRNGIIQLCEQSPAKLVEVREGESERLFSLCAQHLKPLDKSSYYTVIRKGPK
jgi:hypothetical protein